MNTSELFLPPGYRANEPEPVDTGDGTDFWAREAEIESRRARRYQDAVYRHAARVSRSRPGVVLDIGCGTGDGLQRHLADPARRTVGVDQSSAIAIARAEHPDGEWIAADLRDDDVWTTLAALAPSVTICADVIEHVEDPVELLARLRAVAGPTGTLVLSTPDRARLEDHAPLGPPRNAHHIREWSFAEMTSLVQANGFTVRSSRHVLPRRYPLTVLEAKMVAWRALHLRAVPDRRSCMVFELAGV